MASKKMKKMAGKMGKKEAFGRFTDVMRKHSNKVELRNKMVAHGGSIGKELGKKEK